MKELSNIIVKSSNNGISRIKLNEPSTYNALSLNTLKSLIKSFKSFNDDEKTKVIIIEGILLFTHRRLRKLFDAKIYVDTALDFCFIRRLKRDVGERGRTMDSVINQYEDTVRPSFYKFIEPSKKHADVIIPGGGENQVAIDVLSTYVNKLLE